MCQLYLSHAHNTCCIYICKYLNCLSSMNSILSSLYLISVTITKNRPTCVKVMERVSPDINHEHITIHVS